MSIRLFTPATGFPDLEIKIAYGLARVGIETFGMEKVSIRNMGGYYIITIDAEENEFKKLDTSFNIICKRFLSSSYIPFNTPGITGRSAQNIVIGKEEIFSIINFFSIEPTQPHKKSDNCCRHNFDSVGNVIGFTVSTSFHNKRDGLDITWQYKNPKDKNSPKIPRRPTNPGNLCKTCALISLLGMWYASFIFNIKDREVMAIPIPREEIVGADLQSIFSLQHQIRKNYFSQDIPQVIIPFAFLSKIPSSADILEKYDLFVALLSRQQGYHVDGIFLIPIEKYLAFIKKSPYNIAIIEVMIKKEAYGALQELNKVIYYKNPASVLSFARLFVKETTTNNFVNLLYPETAKYLLREVAMIPQEIIENSAIASIARTLRYFIRERKYGYADDIRNARKDARDFEETIAKMLREGRLRLEQKEMIHLPTENETKEVFKLANQDFESTKAAIVVLAFSFPSAKEEMGERE